MEPWEPYLRQDDRYWAVGVDEAGRGPLAGPVVAAAVVLRTTAFSIPLKDSKKLTPRQRRKIFHELHAKAYIGVGMAGPLLIDQINILQATFTAMERAVDRLIGVLPSSDKTPYLLIDGNRFSGRTSYAYQTIVKGDARLAPIAAASIVAKVTRDQLMDVHDRLFPDYGFAKHKGYPTKAHKDAVKRLGRCPVHRKSFRF